MFSDLTEFHAWFSDRVKQNIYKIERIPLEALSGWSISASTGNIAHDSGKFFTVAGVDVRTDHRDPGAWKQPIILQPEIGILGLLVKVVDGVVYCLMQAKMEPGNINVLQLSPTVQATRSNYMRVHQGSAVPYLEYFTSQPGGAVFDALQSEQGSWFLEKRNRNMIVEVGVDVQARADYCWLSSEQIASLLAVPNLVNMDARTVLSGIRFLYANVYNYRAELRDRADGGVSALHSIEYLLSWFTESKSRYSLHRRLLPLNEVPLWVMDAGRIKREDGRHFTVIGVDVRASNREVGHWTQPMFKPSGQGVIAFLGRYIEGMFHVLVHARTEAGTYDVVEMAPTVSCIPSNYLGLDSNQWPRYLDVVESAAGGDIVIDVVHSEEGGRFYHAENRYVVIDVGEEFSLDAPDDYCWMTLDQLTGFVRYSNHVNVAARCLLSCLTEKADALAIAAH